jgi:hypothetical protein
MKNRIRFAMNQRFKQLGALLLFCAVIIAPAKAGVIFSNLGADDSFTLTSGWVVGDRNTPFGSVTLEVALAFTPASDAIFTGADFAAELLEQPGDLTVALLATGDAGTPGAALETFTVAAPALPSLVSIASSLNPVLNAGTEYWLDISSASTAGWWLDNDQGMHGPLAENQNGQGFVLLTDFGGNLPVQPAFRINGDPLGLTDMSNALAGPVDAPEPSSLLLVIAGLLLYRNRGARAKNPEREKKSQLPAQGGV